MQSRTQAVKRDRVLFFFPLVMRNQRPLYPPLEVISLAGVLTQHGYRVSILDQRLKTGWFSSQDLGNIDDLIFVGISTRVGTQCQQALRFAKWIKDVAPDVPLVWGGWGPSLGPSIFAKSSCVDCVVIGEADNLILPLTEAIRNDSGFSHLSGVAYRERGEASPVVIPPREPISELSKTPPMAYHLVDVPSYLRGGNKINYMSSRGCTGECNFCAVTAVHQSQYSALPSWRVVEEISSLSKKYAVRNVFFVDTNFFDDQERALRIAEGFLYEGLGLEWEAYGKADQLLRYTDEEILLFERSGCRLMSVGVETACQKLLDSMEKNIRTEDVKNLVNRLKRTKIRFWSNMMVGLPEETWQDFKDTIELARWIRRQNPLNPVSFLRYWPLPSTSLGKAALGPSHDYASMDLEGVADRFYRPGCRMGWLNRKHETAVRGAVWVYFPLYFMPEDSKRNHMRRRGILGRIKLSILRSISAFRIEHKFFAFPLLWWVKQIRFRFSKVRYLGQ